MLFDPFSLSIFLTTAPDNAAIMSVRNRSRSPRAYVLCLPDVAAQTVETFCEHLPRRPGHRSRPIGDSFMMDFENSLLSEWTGSPPQGPRRFEVEAWGALVKRNVYPHHSDVDWDEYRDWVRAGGGDEWFQEE